MPADIPHRHATQMVSMVVRQHAAGGKDVSVYRVFGVEVDDIRCAADC